MSSPSSAPPLDGAPRDFPHPRAAGCPFDLSPRMRALGEEGPLTRTRIWDGSTPWTVTGHAEQRTLLADPRLSVDPARPGYPSPVAHHGPRTDAGPDLSFVLMDDPEHTRLRRMVSGAFTIKRIESLRPTVQTMVDRAVDDLLAGPNPADLVQALALPIPSLVISELLGVPYAEHEFFQRNSKVIVSTTATNEERGAAHAALGDYLAELVAERVTDPREDLLSRLAAQVAAGALTAAEAAAMGVLLLLAGHETTANMISLGTLLLLQHPDQLALLRDTDDPKVIDAAVEELLRYLTIVHLGRRRTATEDIEIAGRTIRAGDGVILLGELANRDPAVFPDADRLDLTRGDRRHQAFGLGAHHCLGQPLARLELQVVYPTLLRRVPTLRAAADLDAIPFKQDAVIYGLHALPVTW
ncbi:cytochrome P450 [Streptomyces sp. NPDC059639]|uniref:cytochrome P450 n=1 Tax=Streptomyces sp. NPDC059639 TaxID=3346891 RepID=UPI0036A35323